MANSDKLRISYSNCGKCGIPLSDPVSIERGYGPECLKHLLEEGLNIEDFIKTDDIYNFIYNNGKRARVQDIFDFFEIPEKIINLLLIRLYKDRRIQFRMLDNFQSYYYIENGE